MFSIIISEKGGAERRQAFDQREVSIGRVQGNDLVLPKGNVSKRHCRIEWSDGRFLVSDQNSTNGTYLNRRRISQSTVVRQGDRIYLGDYVLRIEDGAVEGDVPQELGVDGAQDPAQAMAYGTQGAMPVPGGMQLGQPTTTSAAGPSLTAPRGVMAGEVESTPGPEQGAGANFGQTTGQMAAHPPAVTRPDEQRSSQPDLRNLRVEGDDATQNSIALVRFVVERVVSQLGRIEIDAAQSAHRVDPALDEVLLELQREGLTDVNSAPLVRHNARAELLEVGPLGALLEDTTVSEIAISGAGFLSVARGTERRAQFPFCAAGSLERAVERLCVHDGVPLHPSEQLAQRFLPSWSFQLDLVRGATAPHGPIVRLRRREPVAVSLEDLVRGGAVSRHLATFLQQCVIGRANILVVGGQRAGADELLSALALATEGERVLMLTDFEVPSAPEGRTMALQESPGVRLDQVLSRLADLGAHRLVIDGLSQGGRALGTLRAMFEGADGVIARLPSRSIERGITQLCSQIALSSPGLSVDAVAEGMVAAFDIAIEVGRLRDGRSRVLRVAELARGQDGSVLANDIFTFVVDRIASGGAVEGSFNPTGRRPHFALALKTRGVRLDSGIFGRAGRTTSPDQK